MRVLKYVHGERERGSFRADGVLQRGDLRPLPVGHIPLRASHPNCACARPCDGPASYQQLAVQRPTTDLLQSCCQSVT